MAGRQPEPAGEAGAGQPGPSTVQWRRADRSDAQESLGSSGESSTYEARDTLTSVHDEKLFAYYGTSQLAVVDTVANRVRPVGQPALFNEVSAAPDGAC